MSDISLELVRKKCAPCEGGVAPLKDDQVGALLNGLSGWKREGIKICKDFRFEDHYQTLAFVNALAWISHREDHHPVVVVGFNTARVEYWTHAIGGLSENDFICAAKADALFEL